MANAIPSVQSETAPSFRSLLEILTRARRANGPLFLTGAAQLILFLIFIPLLALDPRVVTGAPVWLKPAKFALSMALYCFTFQWILGYVRERPLLVRRVSWVTALMFWGESVAIYVQAARGRVSHFNYETPLESAVFSIMGLMITILWLMNLVVLVVLLRQKMTDRVLALALRLGLVLAGAGMLVGFLMTKPTAEQIAYIAEHNTPPTRMGAHTVGAPDGGPGLPGTGWSTVAGDLRAAHFFGMHAMQILPLFGLFVTRRLRGRTGAKLGLVGTAAFVYGGLFAVVLTQALRGQSLVRPDALTLTLLAAVLGFGALAAGYFHITRNQQEVQE